MSTVIHLGMNPVPFGLSRREFEIEKVQLAPSDEPFGKASLR